MSRGCKELSICEIGCGGGDNLRVLSRWCRKRGITVRIMGIDSNPHCLAVAKDRWPDDNAEWIHSDYRKPFLQPAAGHHLLLPVLSSFHRPGAGATASMDGRKGGGRMVVNDLQRHPVAYHSIRLLTAGLSSSYLVKNDAPLSVLRGFSRGEWTNLLQQAGTTNWSIQWKWAFRWLIVGRKQYV